MKTIVALFLLFLFSSSIAQNIEVNPKAETLLNDFMKALAIKDADESAKECLKYVHKSLKNASGDDLTKDLRNFSFKKAHDNVKFYANPVKITRVRKNGVTAIGFKETGEKGDEYSYFISKKSDVKGMPAPVNIFFPADGGEPKISYMGSL
ncbi:MAG: hypothetical protein Q8M29_17690 [Bacteroidota bacterium]|nr:hypothetical protein [Bacteroidota bacterium]